MANNNNNMNQYGSLETQYGRNSLKLDSMMIDQASMNEFDQDFSYLSENRSHHIEPKANKW